MDQTQRYPRSGHPQPQRRLPAADLIVGAMFSVLVAILVALAGLAISWSVEGTSSASDLPVSSPNHPASLYPPYLEDVPDLDISDPLVTCELLVERTRCIREPS